VLLPADNQQQAVQLLEQQSQQQGQVVEAYDQVVHGFSQAIQQKANDELRIQALMQRQRNALPAPGEQQHIVVYDPSTERRGPIIEEVGDDDFD